MKQRKIGALALVALGCSSLFGSVAQAAPWKKFAPSGGGFSVILPSTPKSERKVDKDADGSVTVNQDYTLETPSSLFLVGYQQHDPEFGRMVNAEALLDEMVKTMVKEAGGSVKTRKKIAMSGFPGREVTLGTAENGTVKMRVLWTGSRMHMMMVAFPAETRAARDANRAFNSYALLKTQPKATKQ